MKLHILSRTIVIIAVYRSPTGNPSLNFEKTHCIHLKIRNSPATDMKIGYNNKLIPSVPSTKFLWFTIDSTLKWGVHVDNLTTKLSTACYVIRSNKPYMSHKTSL